MKFLWKKNKKILKISILAIRYLPLQPIRFSGKVSSLKTNGENVLPTESITQSWNQFKIIEQKIRICICS